MARIKELKEQFDMPDCNLIYRKKLQIDIDGDVDEISASIELDLADPSIVDVATNRNGHHKRASSSGPVKCMTGRKVLGSTSKSHVSNTNGLDVSFLDMIQSEMLLTEFERILNIKRGKMLAALKVDQIYEKIYLIESIVD